MIRGLERGEISLTVLPRAQKGVERLVLMLAPEGRSRHRTIVIARRQADRFWGFVDKVVDGPHAGRGTYELAWRDGLARLRYTVDGESAEYTVIVANPDPTAWGLAETPPLQQDLFDKDEVHGTVPASLSARLRERFGGRRFVALDTVEFLDHPGTELVFSGSSVSLSSPAIAASR